jgi:hypothetical protein
LIRELDLTRQSFGGKAVMLDFVKIRNALNACTCFNRHLAWVGLDDEPPSSSACERNLNIVLESPFQSNTEHVVVTV